MYKQKFKELEKAFKSQVDVYYMYMYMYIHAYIVNIILHCVKLCQYHSVWQQKDLKTLKAHGQSKKKAVSTITVATPDL